MCTARICAGGGGSGGQTHLRNLAFLSVEPAPNVAIDGLIAAVPGADWDALDEREMAYHRSPVSDGLTHPGPDTARVEIYQVSPKNMTDGAHPILLSYLDVVVQGYLAEFGADGVAAFFGNHRRLGHSDHG